MSSLTCEIKPGQEPVSRSDMTPPPVTYLELSVALGVLQHVQEELGALLGPAALSPAELFGLKKKQRQVRTIVSLQLDHSFSTEAAQI